MSVKMNSNSCNYTLESYNLKLDRIDRSFDQIGIVPVISTITGIMRTIYGAIELIVGIIKTIIFGILQFMDDECEKEFEDGVIHMGFGAINIIKGSLQTIPVVNILVSGISQEIRLSRKDWQISTPTKDKPKLQNHRPKPRTTNNQTQLFPPATAPRADLTQIPPTVKGSQ